MSDYVSVVTVKGSDGISCMRTAPAWADLKNGDEVMFQTNSHPYEIKGIVIDIATFNRNNEEFRLLRSFVKDNLDMRITKKILYKVFDYEEKEEVANG